MQQHQQQQQQWEPWGWSPAGPPPPPPAPVHGYEPQRGPQLGDISIEYPYENIHRATSGFHAARRLGAGAFGAVYRAEFPDGSEAAVKFIDLRALGGQAQMSGFEEEITMLSKFRHPNLILLMGWGRQDACRFLVYEFLPGGDVHGKLTSCKNSGAVKAPFPWKSRVRVAIEAATGLAYLHNAKPHAFHRDIKSTNILLGPAGAKMADFGLSCVADLRRRSTGANRPPGAAGTMLHVPACGTPGYICPMYASTGRLTEGSEIYSFGMVLLEMLLNVMPAVVAPEGLNFPVQDLIRPEEPGAHQRACEHADRLASWPPQVAAEVTSLALQCVEMADARRPLFNDVCRALRMVEQGQRPSLRRAASARTPLQKSASRYGQQGWGDSFVASPRNDATVVEMARKSAATSQATLRYSPPQGATFARQGTFARQNTFSSVPESRAPGMYSRQNPHQAHIGGDLDADSCADRCTRSCGMQ
mmetsp:Transcript_12317/g.28866  ORF Transcript_12317/g.28866 Transcript_12317/m.28866 type:complete len:474 (-) Transcript_12317:6-1427(-)